MKTKREVVAVVSAIGALLAIVVDLVAYIRELKGEIGECIYRLAKPEGKETLKAIAELIVRDWKKAKGLVTMSLSEMIALGKYNWINSDINAENFPIDKPIRDDEETRLFHFDRVISSAEVEAEMAKEGWKPAKIWHLLFWGAKNPEEQKKYPIVALGSVWRGLVPCLDWDDIDRERYLYLIRFDNEWDSDCRFLAVRK